MSSPSDGGVIYLIHFARPLAHARHYIGYCHEYERLNDRIEYHARGRGSRLLRAVREAGIDFDVVRLFVGSKHDERRLKNRSISKHLCPMCSSSPIQPRYLKEIEL